MSEPLIARFPLSQAVRPSSSSPPDPLVQTFFQAREKGAVAEGQTRTESRRGESESESKKKKTLDAINNMREARGAIVDATLATQPSILHSLPLAPCLRRLFLRLSLSLLPSF